jgi:short-subunit dehydrogenase
MTLPSGASSPQPVALITGGSAGIGLAIAREFAAHGHGVFLIARLQERLQAAAGELERDYGIRVFTLALDVTAPDAVPRIAKALTSSGLEVAYLVNNAGRWLSASLAESTDQDLEVLFATNVVVAHRLTRSMLPAMIARGRGAILNVGSLAGVAPCPGFALYGASKAFLRDATLALRHELKGTGITVSLLAPGVVRTDFFGSGSAVSSSRWLSWLLSSPQTVARAAYRGMLSGQALIVPGLIWRLVWFGARLLPSRLSAHLIALVSARLGSATTAGHAPEGSDAATVHAARNA